MQEYIKPHLKLRVEERNKINQKVCLNRTYLKKIAPLTKVVQSPEHVCDKWNDSNIHAPKNLLKLKRNFLFSLNMVYNCIHSPFIWLYLTDIVIIGQTITV